MRVDLAERALDLARMLRAAAARASARSAGCSRCCWSTRRARRRAPMPAAGCCGWRTRTASLWDGGADRRGRPADRRRADGRAAGPVRAAGGDRGAARAGAELRRDRLAAAPRALRRAAAGLAVAGGRAEPRGGRGDGRRARRRRWPRWRRSRRRPPAGYRYLPATKADLLRRLGRARGGGRGLPRGAGADRERGGAGVPAWSAGIASSRSAGGAATATAHACGRGRSGPRSGARRPPRLPRRPRAASTRPSPRSSAAASAAVSTSPAPIGLTTSTRGASIHTGSWSHATAAPAAAAVTTAASAPRRKLARRLQRARAGVRRRVDGLVDTAVQHAFRLAQVRHDDVGIGRQRGGERGAGGVDHAPAAGIPRAGGQERVAVVGRARRQRAPNTSTAWSAGASSTTDSSASQSSRPS